MAKPDQTHLAPGYRAALVTSTVLNLIMFFAEGGAGLFIGSAALLADAADFLEDSGIYLLAVIAISWPAKKRAKGGLAMGLAMTGVALVALWQVIDRLVSGGVPAPTPMVATAGLALAVNLYCAWRLASHRHGDSGVRAIWLSTRNDAVLNLLTIAAGLVIMVVGRAWPDIAAGIVIVAINGWAAREIIRHALRDLKA